MPPAPKEKASPSSREKGKGKDKESDDGRKDKEPKQRKKPGRVPTSCAECRRLKLKCDRNVPCAKCVSRGCGSICPDGTLAPGKGNRLVLANTEELHARIDSMADRNRALEKALAELYSQSREGQGGVHPLLREGGLGVGDLGRLSVATGSALGGGSESGSRSSLLVPTPSPRASTSASASTSSPTSQSHSHSHSQSRSPAPERPSQSTSSTLQPQRWREVPARVRLQRPDTDDEKMDMDIDLDESHSENQRGYDGLDGTPAFPVVDSRGTLFVSPSDSGSGRGDGGGGSSYYYLGGSARPEILAQIIPPGAPSATFPTIADICAILPDRNTALSLCDVYMAYGTSMYSPAIPQAQLEHIMRTVYRAIDHSPAASPSLLSQIALLLAVFALGAFFSPSFSPYSEECRKLYSASHAALGMLPNDTNETIVQTLLHLAHFSELVSCASPNISGTQKTEEGRRVDACDEVWAHSGRAVRIAQRMGLHVSSAAWPGISQEEKLARDKLWWGVFVADTWASFALGRPPSISRSFVDCAVPENRALPSHVEIVASDLDSIFHSWHLHFTFLLHDAFPSLVIQPKSTETAYAAILEHDRRIRDFYVPRAWRFPVGDDQPTDNSEVRETHQSMGSARKADEEAMVRWLVLSAKEIVLLRLHQPYLVEALKFRGSTAVSDNNVIRQTPYLPSVLAVFRSLRRLSRGLARTWATIPKFLARVSAAWSHGLSAAVTAALLVTRAPDSSLAPKAVDELSTLESIFTAAAPVCAPAANMLGLVRDLYHTAAQTRHARYRSTDTTSSRINGEELERLNGHTASLPFKGRPTSHSSSSTVLLQGQALHPPQDYERNEPRPRSRATSATMSDFANDTHSNQPHTHVYPPHNQHTQPPQHDRHYPHKISRYIMQKLHPVLEDDIRHLTTDGSLSAPPLTFHDPPIDATIAQAAPRRPEVVGINPQHGPAASTVTSPLPSLTSYAKPQQDVVRPEEGRRPEPLPNERSDPYSYPQASPSEGHNRNPYQTPHSMPLPPRVIVDPYLPEKLHPPSAPSLTQYDSRPRTGGYPQDPYTQSYSSAAQHSAGSYPETQPPSYPRERRDHRYSYDDIDDDDTMTSGMYSSSAARSGFGGTSSVGGIGTAITNVSTTTTTTSTMSTSASGGFMPHPFVLGPLPTGFQSGFFPAGFSSGFFPSPIVLDPSWNSFIEQLGFSS